MAFAKASKCNMVASSVLSPHAAIFNTISTTRYTSSSRLSPTAAEFVVSSTNTTTTSDLSPHAFPFASMSTMQAEYNLSLHATCSISTAPFEMAPESGLSPQAASFVPMSLYEMTYDSEMSSQATTSSSSMSSCGMTPEPTLSPQATTFVPMSPSEMTDESGFPPHTVIFKHTPTEQTPCCGNVTQVYLVLPHKYRPGMERIESVIDSCEAALISQYIGMKQHEEECARHYDAFLQWKYFERYDEPFEHQDIENLMSLADARDFQCTMCHNESLELKQQFIDTYDKHMRLVAMHGRASIDFAST